jgi:hypothetical protein
MSTSTFVEEFKERLDFVPVQGQPNLFLIQARDSKAATVGEEMTDEDWNQFEKDIAEAFEQIP